MGGAEVAANNVQLKINKLISAEIDEDKSLLVKNYVQAEMRGTSEGCPCISYHRGRR
jgi:hypothetical protein